LSAAYPSIGPRQAATAPAATPVACEVIAQAGFRAGVAELPALRKAPGPPGDPPPSPGLLRHADEQTVVGLAALLRAVRGRDPEAGGFADWAILSAPRYLGRAAFLASFPQFVKEGAWGISPHLIAAHSLHSPSGTYSQILQAHGPNLGVGGTPGGEREALLAAATLLESAVVPGVWVVFSGPVDRSTRAEGVAPPAAYEALAVALMPVGVCPVVNPARLSIRPGALHLDPASGSREARAELLAWTGAIETAGRVDAGHESAAVPAPHFAPGFARVDAPRGQS